MKAPTKLQREAAREILARDNAAESIADYVKYTNPRFKWSFFSEDVCRHLDNFIGDVYEGKRPILVFAAPPQHGKSELVSRKLPAFLLGADSSMRIGGASYNKDLASEMATDVRRGLASLEHGNVFPLSESDKKRRYDRDTVTRFTAPGGTGGYVGVGIGGGLTGRPLDFAIIDDPIKNHEEALSQKIKDKHWNWYQSSFSSRFSENSGQIIMATQWAEDDLPSRIITQFTGDPRLKVIRYPALNEPGEVGFNPDLPLGPLVPSLHSRTKLLEMRGLMSDYWWSAMMQQSAKPVGGNVFKESDPQTGRRFIQYYYLDQLPNRFDKVIASWDCTFKDTDGSDFVVGQVWGRLGANAFLLDQVRARMSFTETKRAVKELADKWRYRGLRQILIEDKANGPAVIDSLRSLVPGIVPVEPDGSKLARAHAITWLWEACNVYLPHPTIAPWVQAYVLEITRFPHAANDDQVDAKTQGLRHLFPLRGGLNITDEALAMA